MSPVFIFSAFSLWVVFMYANASTNNLSANKTEPKQRAGRWYQDNQYGPKVDAGDYAAPGKPYYSADSSPEEADRNDKSKYNVPTSFADFIPDQKYSSSKVPSKSRPPQSGDWKGYTGDVDYNTPWAFPTDVIALMNAMKEGEKETGLLAKLKAEPIAVFLGLVLPLTLIFAAVWPSLLNFFMNGSMGPQTVSTTASGDNGGNGDNGSTRKGDDPSYVANILGAIESFSQKMLIDEDDKKGKNKH